MRFSAAGNQTSEKNAFQSGVFFHKIDTLLKAFRGESVKCNIIFRYGNLADPSRQPFFDAGNMRFKNTFLRIMRMFVYKKNSIYAKRPILSNCFFASSRLSERSSSEIQ